MRKTELLKTSDLCICSTPEQEAIPDYEKKLDGAVARAVKKINTRIVEANANGTSINWPTDNKVEDGN